MTLMEVGQRFSIHLVRVIPYKKTSVSCFKDYFNLFSSCILVTIAEDCTTVYVNFQGPLSTLRFVIVCFSSKARGLSQVVLLFMSPLEYFREL